MPPSEIIHREPEVLKRTGWSRSTLWDRIAQGLFAPPLELGPRARGWLDSDVVEHQERLKAKRASTRT